MISKRQSAEKSITFLTEIQQRHTIYGTCQAMADQRTKEKKKRGISRQQKPIYVAVDSHWNILFLRSKVDGKPTIGDAKSAIVPHLGENISMITTDKNSCYDFLDQLGYKHEAIKADVGSTEYEAKMKQVNDFCSHLRDKLVSRNGIADRYLQRYLDLFWMVFNFAHKGLNTEKITHYLEKLMKNGTRTKRTDLWNDSKKSAKIKDSDS